MQGVSFILCCTDPPSLVLVEETAALQRIAIDRSAQYMAEESYEFGEQDGQVQIVDRYRWWTGTDSGQVQIVDRYR